MARRKSLAETAATWTLPWPAPWDNDRLLGHGAAEASIVAASTSGRMPHAWLITGPRGIGKSTLAHRFARFLLAGDAGGGLFGAPSSLDVDMDAPAIRRMRAGGHADFRRLQRKPGKDGRLLTRITVDDVRELGQFMHLTPAEGGWRVAIIDTADDMNPNAANALLKLLEEPPERAILILLAHTPGRLLPTIRSRCRRVNLRQLDEKQIIDLLGVYLPDSDPTQRAAIAQLAEGSIGQALALVQAGSLGLYRDVVGVIASLPKLDVAAAHSLGDRVAGRGEAAEAEWRTLVFLFDWWMQRLMRSGAQGIVQPPLVEHERGLAQRLLEAASLDRWMAAWEKASYLFARADQVYLDRKQVTLGAFFALQAAMVG